jgi:hypothetical protein
MKISATQFLMRSIVSSVFLIINFWMTTWQSSRVTSNLKVLKVKKEFFKRIFFSTCYLNSSLIDSLILIKKYNLDILVIKNLNKTISLRTVLYVQEFEIDVAQKSKDKNIKKNVNTHPEVIKLLKEFFYNYSKVKKFKIFKNFQKIF